MWSLLDHVSEILIHLFLYEHLILLVLEVFTAVTEVIGTNNINILLLAQRELLRRLDPNTRAHPVVHVNFDLVVCVLLQYTLVGVDPERASV